VNSPPLQSHVGPLEHSEGDKIPTMMGRASGGNGERPGRSIGSGETGAGLLQMLTFDDTGDRGRGGRSKYSGQANVGKRTVARHPPENVIKAYRSKRP